MNIMIYSAEKLICSETVKRWMKANDTTFKALIEGVKQFMIPVYQRTYAWDPDARKTKAMTVVKMWDDISELLDSDENETHFFGSIVTMPVASGASEVSKFIVIDGQQRLTSLSLLLTAIRNAADELEVGNGPYIHFVEKLEDSFLFNRLREGEDRYKIIPTRPDRYYYFRILDHDEPDYYSSDKLVRAFRFFSNKVKGGMNNFEEIEDKMRFLEDLQNTLLNRLKVVDVRLDSSDDPHDVFESLNYTGIPLSNWDLVRNYILMHYKDQKIQEEKYSTVIKEIEDNIGEQSDEFLKDYLGMNGLITTSRNIYNGFKKLVPDINQGDGLDFENEIKKLTQVSEIYQKLLNPKEIDDVIIRNLVIFSSARLKITTHYPILMKLFKLYDDGLIDKEQFRSSVKLVSSYLLRRTFIYSSQGLNKFFPGVTKSLNDNPVEFLKKTFTSGYYAAPDDKKFIDALKEDDVGTTNTGLAKYLLFKVEQSLNKETPNLKDLQLEHIMPQTLDQEWKDDLGENWEQIHESLLNRFGNLTLTGYNQELQNFSFKRKKEGKNGYENSSVRLTKDLSNYEKWGEEEILNRSREISKMIAEMWNL